MPTAPTPQPGQGRPAPNRVDFLRQLDQQVKTRQSGRPGQVQSNGGQMQAQAPQAQPMSVPAAAQIDGTGPGIPNLGRLFTASLRAPFPQLRSMIPADAMNAPRPAAPTPGAGMNVQGY